MMDVDLHEHMLEEGMGSLGLGYDGVQGEVPEAKKRPAGSQAGGSAGEGSPASGGRGGSRAGSEAMETEPFQEVLPKLWFI